MNYAFLTMLIPKEMANKVKENSSNNMQDAANALQWHIVEGLSANIKEPITLFNVMPVGSFPQYYKKAFVKTEQFDSGSHSENINMGFCNVKLIRKYHQAHVIYKHLNKWCRRTSGPKTLFIYTAAAPFLKAAYRLKKKYSDLMVCSIVADLPDMSSLSSKKSLLQKIFIKNQSGAAYARLSCVDGFVLLTRHMADYMHLTVPYCVMEGIATAGEEFVSEEVNPKTAKTIMYSGTLHKRFGVLNLVDAFMQIPDENVRLTICGVGDCSDIIKEKAAQDPRIDFCGQLPREEVLKRQSQADVLVNPRQNIEEFTKYSFPSKNLEYLSSGVPFVAYKLDGIPDDYDDYINYVGDNSVEALRDVLVNVCQDVDGIYTQKAKAASHFVRTYKNAVVQTAKIIDLLGNLS